ncbi:lig_chan-Glu_bd domain-containing protein [Trichonephila clavipes]|nr:lig_chan-Glu_bd domain-containing protein [Trichonephila clavipes]
MNIKYDTVFPEDNEYGREIHDGNWTGLIGMVKRGEADLAIGTLGISENRFRVIDFSFPYTAGRLTFAVLKPSQWLTTFGFLDVFDFPTWMLLLSSFLLSTVMFPPVLKAVDKGNHHVYSLNGTLTVPFFLNSKEPYLQLLGRMIEQNNCSTPQWLVKNNSRYSTSTKGAGKIKHAVVLGLIPISSIETRPDRCAHKYVQSIVSVQVMHPAIDIGADLTKNITCLRIEHFRGINVRKKGTETFRPYKNDPDTSLPPHHSLDYPATLDSFDLLGEAPLFEHE